MALFNPVIAFRALVGLWRDVRSRPEDLEIISALVAGAARDVRSRPESRLPFSLPIRHAIPSAVTASPEFTYTKSWIRTTSALVAGAAPDVRSKPESSEPEHLRRPLSLPTRLAVPSAVTASPEFADPRPRIHTPQALTTDAALYTLTVSRLPQPESQLLILSVSKGSKGNDANATRRLIALSVPTEVARQLLFIPVSPDTPPPTPGFLHAWGVDSGPVVSNSAALQSVTPVRQLFAVSNSHNLAMSLAFAKDNAKHPLLEASKIGVSLISIASVFSDREIAVAEKLVDLFACSDIIGLRAAMLGFNEDDFLTAHALLSRFDPPKCDRPDEYSFSPRDVVAARQLRALFASNDLQRPIGPIFLTFLHADGCVQLMPLSDSEDAAQILFDLFLPGYPVHPRR